VTLVKQPLRISSHRQQRADRLVAAVAVNYPLNSALCGAHLFLNLFVLFGFPLLFLPDPRAAILIVVAISCTSNGLFSVLHEAIHRSLAPVTRLPLIGLSMNDLLGRVVGIVFGSPFDFVSAAHVTHHSVNRTADEHLEVYDRSLPDVERRSFVKGYYFFLLGGLYTVELIVPMLFWLPQRIVQPRLERLFQADPMARQVLRRICRSPHRLRAVRVDAGFIVASIAASTVLYGRYWWILALHFLIRAFLVSLLDYVYHYGSPLGDRLHGYNLELPRWLSPLILNFNYHGVHHRFPALPWRSLERVFVDEGLVFDNHYLTQAVSQLRGPMTRETLELLLGKHYAEPRGSAQRPSRRVLN
jgi:fatty acid desaturase